MNQRSWSTVHRALVAGLLLLATGFASAGAPLQKTQVPGYYRMALGGIEMTALFDGALELDSNLLKNTSAREVSSLHARQFIKGSALQVAVNAFVINIGGKLVLVDAGAGKAFGPKLGQIVANLKAAGHTPEQIDVVLITHLHGDHVAGLADAEGRVVFPNAQVWSAQADNEFWLSEAIAAKAPKEAQPFFKMARDAAAPYIKSGQWKTFTSDQELVPGIVSFAANGHTPGHSGYLIGSGEDRLLIWGDIVHNHAVQFARPQVAIEFDVDPKAAVVTRKRILAKAAKERLLIAGMHLPFPGIGHVRQEARGYSWVPVDFSPLPD